MRLAAIPARKPTSRWLRPLRVAATGVFALIFFAVVTGLGYALVRVLLGPLPPGTSSIPFAILASSLRLLLAYAITVAWTVPAAIYIARHERASQILMPFTQIMASIPAVAFFPLIVLLLAGASGSLEVPSVLLVLTGMQWYLLFNLIAGARAVPNDLLAVAQMHGLKGRLLWKRVLLPAMMPAFLTGSITAWGGGWNALIVSEFVRFGGHTYHAFGIGDLIARAADEHDGAKLLLTVVSMVAAITLLNTLVWKRLYARAMTKFRLEGGS